MHARTTLCVGHALIHNERLLNNTLHACNYTLHGGWRACVCVCVGRLLACACVCVCVFFLCVCFLFLPEWTRPKLTKLAGNGHVWMDFCERLRKTTVSVFINYSFNFFRYFFMLTYFIDTGGVCVGHYSYTTDEVLIDESFGI